MSSFEDVLGMTRSQIETRLREIAREKRDERERARLDGVPLGFDGRSIIEWIEDEEFL